MLVDILSAALTFVGCAISASASHTRSSRNLRSAGVQVVGDEITEVKGRIQIPNLVVPPGGDPHGTYGVSLGISLNSTCENGIMMVYQNGSIQAHSTYALNPAKLESIEDFPAKVGHEVGIHIYHTSTAENPTVMFVFTNSNETPVRLAMKAHSRAGGLPLCLQSAEWWLETVTFNGVDRPLADFGTATIEGATYVSNGTSKGVGEADNAVIKDLP